MIIWRLAATCLLGAAVGGCADAPQGSEGLQPVAALPDISGMEWIDGERLLVVHDAKRGKGEGGRPRVGVVSLPAGPAGMRYRPLDVDWPVTGPSHDLESVARIPGTNTALLGESGDDGADGPRIYLVEFHDTRLELLGSAPWPAPIRNVEATAVVRVNSQLIFVYAERNQDQDSTAIRWATLDVDSLRFGEFEEFRFATPDRPAINRGIVALETEPSGHLLAAGSFDPDVDGGPFQSRIYRLGRFLVNAQGQVQYDGQPPERLFTVDGVKIEALAARTIADGTTELVYGSDDEDFGGIVRRLQFPHD